MSHQHQHHASNAVHISSIIIIIIIIMPRRLPPSAANSPCLPPFLSHRSNAQAGQGGVCLGWCLSIASGTLLPLLHD